MSQAFRHFGDKKFGMHAILRDFKLRRDWIDYIPVGGPKQVELLHRVFVEVQKRDRQPQKVE